MRFVLKVCKFVTFVLINIFSIYGFFAEGKKSKYRWFKVVGFGGGGFVGSKKKCNVSGVRCHKGFHVLNSARQASPCKRPRARGQPIPPQSYSISK